MIVTPEVMRALLVSCLIGTSLLAVLYLSRKQMSPCSYLFWGLVAALLPLLGPMLVIICGSGISRQR